MPAVEDSILDTTKKMLGIEFDYTAFDIDIITHINSVFSSLQLLGVGPDDGFMITDSSTLWATYLGGSKVLNLVKSYMYLKVRMLFDPPATSFDINAKQELIKEMEWKITVFTEPPIPTATTEDPSYEDLIWAAS